MSPRSISGGWIEVVTGTMFAGKTEEVIRRLERAEIDGYQIEVFKPEMDDRYGDDVIGSHRGSEWKSKKIETGKEERIVEQADKEAEVIAIDEANFFEQSLLEAVQELADQGYRVIVAGLDQTYRGEPFQPMGKIMAVAEYVEKFRAICEECGEPATRPQRYIDGEPAHVDDPTIVVGAEEKYEARCRDCHEVRE